VVDHNDGRRFQLPDRKIQFSAARFDGVLQISDADLFTDALESGIGSAKGFGFGLLSVALTESGS
jgi:CRISPR system Cascade subunit CasE